MASFNKLFTAFYGSLGLQSSKNLTAYGRQGGFPVALRLDNLQRNGLLILQARFRPEQAVPKSLAFEPPLQELLRAGQARLGTPQRPVRGHRAASRIISTLNKFGSYFP